ncbi:pyridine nucleotide-disulfide oxidoreductase [Nocardioides koreensis]|uniref:pyridine nucleotide-disulfide oxidoreductase n=1 Tax=Nocardioides koreensis TaxID=433651 RepID=UPI0031E3A931
MPTDSYGYRLTTSSEAAAAYNRGIGHLLRLRTGAVEALATSVALDPTFALGHAALALLGHEMCAPVDLRARLDHAALHAARASDRERSHVAAITSHVRGSSAPLVRHLAAYPRDALLLTTAVPTIAFAGVTEVPAEGWVLVERAIPAYGDDWWFAGLLAFVRQEQRRFDEAMSLACRSLAREPDAGHSAHARAHAHYETGDHEAGLSWMDGWVTGAGAGSGSRSHFSWHAAMHELSLGDLDAVRRRYDAQLRPVPGLGCRTLVDSGSLLFRWGLTPGAVDVPGIEDVATVVGREVLEAPATPFLAMHAAVTLLALDDGPALARLAVRAERHPQPTQREVVAPLVRALALMRAEHCSQAADALAALTGALPRLGGSDAQREIIEETRIAALLRAGRLADARAVLDVRLDRRRSPRDEAWRRSCSAPDDSQSGQAHLAALDGHRDLLER